MNFDLDKPLSIERRLGALAGVTLLELLVVLSLVSLVLGAGLGALASFDVGNRAARGLVQNVFRSAANSALARDAPAVVVLDPASGRLSARALKVIGTWHFESEDLAGAFGLDGELFGARLVDDGHLGRALSFAGSGSPAWAEFPIGRDPAFDLDDGFALACSVRLEGGGTSALVDVGGAAGLELGPDGALVAWLIPAVVDARLGSVERGARIGIETLPGALVPGDWHHVQATYDRARFELAIDGVTVAALRYDTPVWPSEGPLVVGDRRRSFPGRIDTLVVSSVVAQSEATLPEGVVFGSQSTELVRFAAGGHLDRMLHEGPAAVELEYADGKRDRILIGMYGTVE